jgi:hypothetical protein
MFRPSRFSIHDATRRHASPRRLGAPRRGPPHEIAFGVVGRFWAGETVWAQIDAADFEAFAEPGFAKIARNFSLRPHGPNRTLVTYECRTLATDETAHRGFKRYWRPLAPFIGLVMGSQLRVIEAETAGR